MVYTSFADVDAWTGVRVDGEMWDRRVERLTVVGRAAGDEPTAVVLRGALVAAAVNTGAIEGLHAADRGLTITAVRHAADWEPVVRRAQGPDVEAYVRAAMEAFDLALDVATDRSPLSEALIRRIHEVACAPQATVTVHVEVAGEVRRQDQPLLLGAYKERPNSVLLADGTMHEYCPADLVPVEVHRLVTQAATPAFTAAHPVVQAAYLHHALTVIHPFEDGNGRVARLVASIPLLRAASIPFLVYVDQKPVYLDALAEADAGTLQPFVDFVFDRSIDLLNLTADLLGAEGLGGGGTITVSVPRREVAPDVEDAARRVATQVDTALSRVLARVSADDGVRIEERSARWHLGGMDARGRRTVQHNFGAVRLEAPQYGVTCYRSFPVFAALDDREQFAVSVSIHGSDDQLELRLRDVHPEMTIAVRQLIEAFVERAVVELIAEFQEQLRAR